MRKKIVISLLTVLILLVTWQFELIIYGFTQGKGQIKILLNVVETKDLLLDPAFPDSLKNKIRIINKARKFATDELRLTNSDNYTSYFDEGGEVTLWNVSACLPYKFEPKTWWFPFVGNVPYKGYFKKEKAETLYDELQEEGLDARMRPVGGWSTLGWFRDPILSSMLERSEGQLAELIIHELTHGTVFVSNEVTFNENLASFIGERGAVEFLKKEYGSKSIELGTYVASELDSKLFTKHILRGTEALEKLYRTFDNEPDSIKFIVKNNLIREICLSVDSIRFSSERYSNVFKSQLPNNAYFMSFLRYHSAEDSLQGVLDESFNGNLRLFIKDAIERHGD